MAWTGEATEVTGEKSLQKAVTAKPKLGYAWYVVFVLMTCYTLSFIDRQILALLVGPIKKELNLSDTRIGLLGGLAFALFYTMLGLPMGRLADNRCRRNIVAVGVFLWSLMTGVCSIARTFWTLFLARMGVGIGEAALAPSAFSLITDYFPRERLGTALSVYSMGIFIGSGLALMISGAVIGALSHLPPVHVWLIGPIASWRLTFLIVGVPGLMVTFLVYTIREPLRRNLLATGAGQTTKLSVSEVVSQLKVRWQSVLGVAFAFSFQSSCTYGIGFWAPTFLIRVHGWNASDTGWVLGIITLVTGCVGMYAGGRLCDRWQQDKIYEAPLKVGVIGTGGAGVFFVLAMLVPSAKWSLALMVPGFTLLAMPIGTAHASMQLILPNQVRGQISAFYLFILNMGLILGPYLPGAFNDYLFKNENMLAYSIALAMGICASFAVILLKATYRPYRRHYRMMHEAN